MTAHTSLPGYTYAFRRWLGRDLAPWEHRIITSIEYRRTHGISQLLYVGDDGTHGTRLIDLLVGYLRWRKAKIMPGADILVMDVTRTRAAAIARRIPGAYPASARRPDSIRSHTFHLAMLLNVHDPAWRHSLDRTFPAVLPMLPAAGHGLLIVHGHVSRHIRTPFTGACMCIRSRAPAGASVYLGNTDPPPFDPAVDRALAIRAKAGDRPPRQNPAPPAHPPEPLWAVCILTFHHDSCTHEAFLC